MGPISLSQLSSNRSSCNRRGLSNTPPTTINSSNNKACMSPYLAHSRTAMYQAVLILRSPGRIAGAPLIRSKFGTCTCVVASPRHTDMPCRRGPARGALAAWRCASSSCGLSARGWAQAAGMQSARHMHSCSSLRSACPPLVPGVNIAIATPQSKDSRTGSWQAVG